MTASCPSKADVKALSVYSGLMTRTDGGKVEVLDGRLMIVTSKVEYLRSASNKCVPRFPPAYGHC